jgi:hypothetical protein
VERACRPLTGRFDGRTGLVVLAGIGVPNLLNMGFPAAVAEPRCPAKCTKTLRKLATPAGFEPATPSLEGWCSIRLSYGVDALVRFTRSARRLKGAKGGHGR